LLQLAASIMAESGTRSPKIMCPLPLTMHGAFLSPNSVRERFVCVFPCQRDARWAIFRVRQRTALPLSPASAHSGPEARAALPLRVPTQLHQADLHLELDEGRPRTHTACPGRRFSSNTLRHLCLTDLAREHLLRLLHEIPLGEAEQSAVEDGLAAYENLLTKLGDVPTPAGSTLDRSLLSWCGSQRSGLHCLPGPMTPLRDRNSRDGRTRSIPTLPATRRVDSQLSYAFRPGFSGPIPSHSCLAHFSSAEKRRQT
jgi:hypothetical protein